LLPRHPERSCDSPLPGRWACAAAALLAWPLLSSRACAGNRFPIVPHSALRREAAYASAWARPAHAAPGRATRNRRPKLSLAAGMSRRNSAPPQAALGASPEVPSPLQRSWLALRYPAPPVSGQFRFGVLTPLRFFASPAVSCAVSRPSCLTGRGPRPGIRADRRCRSGVIHRRILRRRRSGPQPRHAREPATALMRCGGAHGVQPFAALILPVAHQGISAPSAPLAVFRVLASMFFRGAGRLKSRSVAVAGRGASTAAPGFFAIGKPLPPVSGRGRCCPGLCLFQVFGHPIGAPVWARPRTGHRLPVSASGPIRS